MELNRFYFTDIYWRKTKDNQINLIFFNKKEPSEILVFIKFSFYIVNIAANTFFKEFTLLPSEENKQSNNEMYVEAIKATDINDIVYVRLSDERLIVISYTLDNYTGDSYQLIRIVDEKSKLLPTPLGISEYEKFFNDFKSEQYYCDVLDLRFK